MGGNKIQGVSEPMLFPVAGGQPSQLVRIGNKIAVWQLGSQNWGDPKDPGIDPKVIPEVIKFGPHNDSLRVPPKA